MRISTHIPSVGRWSTPRQHRLSVLSPPLAVAMWILAAGPVTIGASTAPAVASIGERDRPAALTPSGDSGPIVTAASAGYSARSLVAQEAAEAARGTARGELSGVIVIGARAGYTSRSLAAQNKEEAGRGIHRDLRQKTSR